ncbi:hypothetical protein E2I00_017183, partial [Balaenoptera physalus]
EAPRNSGQPGTRPPPSQPSRWGDPGWQRWALPWKGSEPGAWTGDLLHFGKGRMHLSGVKKKSLLGVKENNKKSSTRAPSPTKRKDRSDEKSKDRSKDKGATKKSSEKDLGRDKTRKRRSASSGSSSTRSRSSSTSSLGSSTSTGSSSGSSSSSASSRSGSSSTSCSSSSGSSPGSPSPSQRRQDSRRRSRSKSKPPKRGEKERKRQSPSPKHTKVHTGRLTRNVTKDHIMEIFSTYGKIKMIDVPIERMHPHLSKGYAYVDRRRIGRKEIPHSGAGFEGEGSNCHISPGGRVQAAGVLLLWGRAYKDALQFSGWKASTFLAPESQFSGKASRDEPGAPEGGTAPAWQHVFPFHR